MASGGGGDESRREGTEDSWVPSLYNDDFDSDSDVVPGIYTSFIVFFLIYI